MATLMQELAARLTATETLAQSVISMIDWESALIPYEHIEGKHVATVKVRSRNAGRLPPREIALDDD